VQEMCRRLIAHGVALSAHDCSDGGLAVALAECAIIGASRIDHGPQVGFTAGSELLDALPARWDAALFGETNSRILVTVSPERVSDLADMARKADVPVLAVGQTGGARFRLGSLMDLPVSALADAWYGGLKASLE
jgi:phosphoribosylformylglycinamidine synthase